MNRRSQDSCHSVGFIRTVNKVQNKCVDICFVGNSKPNNTADSSVILADMFLSCFSTFVLNPEFLGGFQCVDCFLMQSFSHGPAYNSTADQLLPLSQQLSTV